jgi:hypothetical protein
MGLYFWFPLLEIVYDLGSGCGELEMQNPSPTWSNGNKIEICFRRIKPAWCASV